MWTWRSCLGKRSELNAPLSDSNCCYSSFGIYLFYFKSHIREDAFAISRVASIDALSSHEIIQFSAMMFYIEIGSMECVLDDCFVVWRTQSAHAHRPGKKEKTDSNGATRIFGWFTRASITGIVPATDANNSLNNERGKNTKTTWNKRSSLTRELPDGRYLIHIPKQMKLTISLGWNVSHMHQVKMDKFEMRPPFAISSNRRTVLFLVFKCAYSTILSFFGWS